MRQRLDELYKGEAAVIEQVASVILDHGPCVAAYRVAQGRDPWGDRGVPRQSRDEFQWG